MKIYVLVLAILISACNLEMRNPERGKKEKSAQKKDGLVKTFRENGKPMAEINYKDGKKHGLARDFYPNGHVHFAIMYDNGIKHGITKMYYENGTLYRETPYNHGKITGVQKKYREDGKLFAEVPYQEDCPCVGLKEYLVDGSPKKKFPTIVITPVDDVLRSERYKLRVSMSDNTRSVTFYRGALKNGCLDEASVDNLLKTQEGVGELSFYLPRGSYIMEEVNIIAKVKTLLGNEYIIQRKFNVAVENR